MSFRGYIRVVFDEERLSRFINQCRLNNIPLHNIKREADVFYADVQSKHYSEFASLAKEYEIKYRLVGKFGFLMKIILYKGRKVFLGAALLLALYYAINYCFISEIVINGNKVFSKKQIIQCLEENDIYVGRLKFGINPEIFQNEFIKDFSGVSWIWIRIDGTKAIVDLREKVTIPEFFDYSKSGNVVASKDGVVVSAISSAGTLLVHKGMYVRKGDILISGVYDSNEIAPLRFVNAGGSVFAKTKYTLEDNFSLSFVSYKPLTELETIYIPRIFDISLWERNTQKGDLVITDNDVSFRIFGKNYLPLAFTKTKYCEIIRNEYTLSASDAHDFAIAELTRRLSLTLPDSADIVNTEKNIYPNADGSFRAKVSFECIEDIAAKQPIEVVAD